MDSGAFSAWKSGAQIDVTQYIATAKELLATDPTLSEVYALDVIGDHKATLKNVETMWEAGIAPIPTFHEGEPEKVL